MKSPQPDLQPDVSVVKAIVTTRWQGKAYRPLVINSLEQYYIDTAMDNDADTWTCDIGDPEGLYLPMLNRDYEVRCQIFGVGKEGTHHMLTGIADDVEYTDGSWTLTGRDLSSLATDSTPLPKRWAKARAWAIVKEQARNVGFHHTRLSHTGIVKKLQYTDGSESYWDFWYRLYRQEQMWLWTTPTGILTSGKLNYGDDPVYFLGDAQKDDNAFVQNRIIPVISAVLTKNVQGRLHEVVIYGNRGNVGFSVPVKDPTLHNWRKRPRKVMLDSTSRTIDQAKKMAWEEIFEGKVGSIELKITIPDPGFVVQSDKVARLYLGSIDLHGHYYIVGSRIQGGPDGFVQEIRLREREYALSDRVPTAPKLKSSGPQPGKGTGPKLGKGLEGSAGLPNGWGDYFIKAAHKYHGLMDYSLFLACLLGIAYVETGGTFKNERQDGGPGGDGHVWHPFKPSHSVPIVGDPPPGIQGPPFPPPTVDVSNSRRDWERKFANEPGVYGITTQHPWPGGSGVDAGQGGVGPMQLTSTGLKHSADDLLRPGHHNQYEGGRWHPEHNIMIGARTLHNACQYFHAKSDNDIWLPVDAYNHGEGGAQSYFRVNGHVSSYAEAVRKAVLHDPGFLKQVQQDITTSNQSVPQGKDFTNPFPLGWVASRADMGWDGTFKARIVAPFEGTIMFAGVLQGHWLGSRAVIIRSKKKLPLASNTLYFAEGLTPRVKAGDHVMPGQVIAISSVNPYNGTVGNIEFGLAAEGRVGQQTDPLAETGVANRRKVVRDFIAWAQGTLHVSGHVTDWSHLGYA